MNPSGSEVRQTAWQLCLQGHFDDAHRLLAAHLACSADDVEAWVFIARLSLQRQDHARAMTAAATAVRLDPTHVQALYILGRAHHAEVIRLQSLPEASQVYPPVLAGDHSVREVQIRLRDTRNARAICRNHPSGPHARPFPISFHRVAAFPIELDRIAQALQHRFA
jgi:hypothetical protein